MVSLLFRCFQMSIAFRLASCHGRLFQPPSRSSAWRYGFTTPHNYNDHELYCGGYSTQWGRNGGKCGPCGDPYHQSRPRDNENGGKYGRGVIVQKYKEGQEIEIGVELTANHKGFFEFRVCAHNAISRFEADDCFKYLLLRSDSEGARYYPGPGSKKFFVKYLLPKTVTCKQCVLQWRYVAGNNWGMCPNGTGMVGCGPQEEFRSCSDILITDQEGLADQTPGVVPKDIPEDEEDYNEVDHSLHAYGGQVTAFVLAFLFVLLFLMGLLITHIWNKGVTIEMLKNCCSQWIFLLMPVSLKEKAKYKFPPTKINETKLPPIPPRRNRPTKPPMTTQPPGLGQSQRPIRSISAPMRVSINGVEVTQNHCPGLHTYDLKGS